MKIQKALRLALCWALVLCLGACGEKEASGVLSLEETARLEALLGESWEESLEVLYHVDPKEAVPNKGAEETGEWKLPVVRNIQGQEFEVFLNQWNWRKLPVPLTVGCALRSPSLPKGEETAALIQKICQEARDVYGEPAMKENSRAKLEAVLDGQAGELLEKSDYFIIYWELGEKMHGSFAALNREDGGVGIFLKYEPDSQQELLVLREATEQWLKDPVE